MAWLRMEEYGKFGKFEPSALPPELQSRMMGAAARRVHDFTVGFVLNNQILGSGTVVSVGGKVGILTAAHVADEFSGRLKKNVGLVISKHRHHFQLQPEILERVDFLGGRGPMEDSGPDITFLRILSHQHIDQITALKNVYRLDGKSLLRFQEFPLKFAMWFVAGVPAVFSSKSEEPEPLQGWLNVTTFIGPARFVGWETGPAFDIMRFSLPSGSDGYPSHYGGVSGGGNLVQQMHASPQHGDRVSGTRASIPGRRCLLPDRRGQRRLPRPHRPRPNFDPQSHLSALTAGRGVALIRTYFRDRQADLLVLDIREGWGPLCRFLGRVPPAQAFPWQNKTFEKR
jgi:hypothetical protein